MSKELLEAEYKKFFKKFNIDDTSGVLRDHPTLRFATYPYIGSKYFDAKTKILFIGMDIGIDEKHNENRYQDFEDRNNAIEQPSGFNPHIAGTYCSALYLLREQNSWEDLWNEFSRYPTYMQATKEPLHKDGENPLAFVSLTNYCKFVIKDKQVRKSDLDSISEAKEAQESLLLKEIEILKPDIVLFQGRTLPYAKITRKITDKKIEIIRAYHPSWTYGNEMFKPQNYVDKFEYIKD